MTQTTSFKANVKNAASVFKWEFKNRLGSLAVFSILAGAFTAIILTLCLVTGFSSKNPETLSSCVLSFQMFAMLIVYLLTAIFAIVYTAGNYSYLHNKRKLDMYGQLPVSASALYISKTISAYLLSAAPAAAFFLLISIISAAFGVPPTNESLTLFCQMLRGSLACITFYGLLAVCCGTTVHSVISFAAVCVAYPIATAFFSGTAHSFFPGLPVGVIENSFVMYALNPLAAYTSSNTLYWLLFSAACLALSVLLVRKRKNERAQTSFAFFLPAYIVKLLVSFIIGMFVGVIFGAFNVFDNGYAGFVFGFALGSVPAFVIAHLIYYGGAKKLLKTSISLGVMFVLTIGVMALVNSDPSGYGKYVPAREDIASAGVIDSTNCYADPQKPVSQIAREAAEDYKDDGRINSILKFHKSFTDSFKSTESNVKFRGIFASILRNVFSEYDAGYYISYKLNDGRTVVRQYPGLPGELLLGLYEDADYKSYSQLFRVVISSKEYFDKYSFYAQLDPSDIKRIRMYDYSDFEKGDDLNSKIGVIDIKANKNVSSEKAAADKKKILQAVKQDFYDGNNNYFSTTDGSYSYEDSNLNDLEFEYDSSKLGCLNKIYSGTTEVVQIAERNKNLLSALREVGVLTENNELNEKSPYFSKMSDYELYSYSESPAALTPFGSLLFGNSYEP